MTASLLDAPRLSITEAARRLGVHTSSVWRWVLTGARGRKLPTIMVGARRYIIIADLEKFLASGLTSASSAATHLQIPTEERACSAAEELKRRGI